MLCSSNGGCLQALYCKKSTCALDVAGRCATRPVACGADEAPFCGCDGITYFNLCLAEQNGQNVASNEACGNAGVPCIPGETTCAAHPNGYCGVLLEDNNACSLSQTSGRCWVLPEGCAQFDTHFNGCNGGGNCVHTCDAVKSEKPFYPVSNCH